MPEGVHGRKLPKVECPMLLFSINTYEPGYKQSYHIYKGAHFLLNMACLFLVWEPGQLCFLSSINCHCSVFHVLGLLKRRIGMKCTKSSGSVSQPLEPRKDE